MQRPRLWLAMLGILCLAGPVRAHFPPPPSGVPVCVCAEVRGGVGWCAACGVGYVAGVTVPSRSLYEMLDPHGHDVDVARMSCAACRGAWESDGFCAADGIGFAAGRAYVSRLAWLLARGESPEAKAVRVETARLRGALVYVERCELCAVAAFVDGRCPLCKSFYRNGRPVTAVPAGAGALAPTSR